MLFNPSGTMVPGRAEAPRLGAAEIPDTYVPVLGSPPNPVGANPVATNPVGAIRRAHGQGHSSQAVL